MTMNEDEDPLDDRIKYFIESQATPTMFAPHMCWSPPSKTM
jgi:hypothetical protein